MFDKADSSRSSADLKARELLIKRAGKPPWQGILSLHLDGFGFVIVPLLPYDLFIPSRYVNGAMDGDGVEIDLLPDKRKGKGLAAQITKVLWRKRSHVRGRLRKEQGMWWLHPLNPRLPWMQVGFKNNPSLKASTQTEGTLVRARITRYPQPGNNTLSVQPEAILADDQDPNTLAAHILDDLELRQHFSTDCCNTANQLAAAPPDLSGSHRQDLEKLPFITIDGDDAADFDDAIHLSGGGDQPWQLRVAIADVSAYVQPGDAIDQEARLRGTSVYLPGMMLPMLPHSLCTNLCSLIPAKTRAVMVCDILLDQQGNRLQHKIYHAFIRSHARLTYQQVQAFFDNQQPLPQTENQAPLAPMLQKMRQLAQTLSRLRYQRGALDFDLAEIRIQLNDQGLPQDITLTKPTEATKLIEQFMLEANETTALHALKLQLPVLFRTHQPPPTDKLQSTLLQLAELGVRATENDLQQPKKLQQLLEKTQKAPLNNTLQLIILKSMAQAAYLHKNQGHFALNAPHYTHFTSPIRRYPDLLLHRALSASLLQKNPRQLHPSQGLLLSQAERNAASAEHKINRLYQILLMEPQLGKTFQATITSVNDRGMELRLLSPPISGFLPFTNAAHRKRQSQRHHQRQPPRQPPKHHQRHPAACRPGSTISCKLTRASKENLQLEFSPC